MTAPSLLGMEWTSWRHFARSIFFHSSRMTSFRDWMLDGEWCSTCLFRIPHRCSIGFRSGDILGHWITFTLFFFRNPTVALDVCLGSLSCWKSARRPRARSDGSIFTPLPYCEDSMYFAVINISNSSMQHCCLMTSLCCMFYSASRAQLSSEINLVIL